MEQENQLIVEAIRFFEDGKWAERRKYYHDLVDGKGVKKNGFTFYLETYCYVVYKDTEEDGQYKGQPIRKVVPLPMDYNKIPAVLEAQYWVYD